MQRLNGWSLRPLDLLDAKRFEAPTAEERIERETFYKFLIPMREWPEIGMQVLAGVFEPVHQRTMLRIANKGAGTNVNVSSRGTSKCVCAGTRIRMANGRLKTVEKIRVGDYVRGPDGLPKEVVATANGVGPMYRVDQTHGMSYTVTPEHVLTLKHSNLNVWIEAETLYQSGGLEVTGYKADGSSTGAITLTPVGEGEWAGFTCDGGLFLLADGTVTHNSSTMGVQYPVYKLNYWMRVKSILLSASGFRGGQGLFNDLSRMVRGGWDSQKTGLEFLRMASTNPKIIHRAANFWAWDLANFSAFKTLPTKDPDGIRGERANLLFIDESNFVNEELITRVAVPFLNVKGDFEHGGAYAQSNAVFYTTTVDFAWRPFGRIQDGAWGELVADYEAVRAKARGDKKRYLLRASEGFAKYTYVCFDYTDTFIRQKGMTRDGRRYRVKWPNPKLPLQQRPGGIPFTERTRSGGMRVKGQPTAGWTTYPIDFDAVEGGLYDGSTPVEAWLSEQRNVRDTAQGDVFPQAVMDQVAFSGDRYLIPYDQCGKQWQERYSEELLDYAPSVHYRHADPCVLGVDYAGGDRDFAAFVVIRIGPMAQGTFDPMTGAGKTPYCNVIWAEQHRMMSHEQAAEKIWQFAERYNLVYYASPGLDDDWRVCRAIGLDMRGGGVGVRDQLVHINSSDLKVGEYRIYDPLDTDARVQAFARDPKAKPMLDAISPTDILNDRLVEFVSGQFQKKLCYLAKFVPEALRPTEERADISMAYNAIKTLEHQLRKIQQEPTKNARRFYMAGDVDRTDKKKDLFSAFIYGMKQVRAHLIRLRMIDTTRAEASAERMILGGNPKLRGIGGKAPGSKL